MSRRGHGSVAARHERVPESTGGSLSQDQQLHHLLALVRASVRANDVEGFRSALAALNRHNRLIT